MQNNIHPKYQDQLEITCACGNTITTGSTVKESIRVEICSNCHPFWTGEKKLIDTEGRVERFARQENEAKKHKAELSTKKKSKKDRQTTSKKSQPLTLKDMLAQGR